MSTIKICTPLEPFNPDEPLAMLCLPVGIKEDIKSDYGGLSSEVYYECSQWELERTNIINGAKTFRYKITDVVDIDNNKWQLKAKNSFDDDTFDVLGKESMPKINPGDFIIYRKAEDKTFTFKILHILSIQYSSNDVSKWSPNAPIILISGAATPTLNGPIISGPKTPTWPPVIYRDDLNSGSLAFQFQNDFYSPNYSDDGEMIGLTGSFDKKLNCVGDAYDGVKFPLKIIESLKQKAITIRKLGCKKWYLDSWSHDKVNEDIINKLDLIPIHKIETYVKLCQELGSQIFYNNIHSKFYSLEYLQEKSYEKTLIRLNKYELKGFSSSTYIERPVDEILISMLSDKKEGYLPILVRGESGHGKSTLLLRFIYKMLASVKIASCNPDISNLYGHDDLFVYLDASCLGSDVHLGSDQRIQNAIEATLQIDQNHFQSLNDLLKNLGEYLASGKLRPKVWFIFDGLNESPYSLQLGTLIGEVFNFIKEINQEWMNKTQHSPLRLIVSLRKDFCDSVNNWAIFNLVRLPFGNDLKYLDVGEFSESEAKEAYHLYSSENSTEPTPKWEDLSHNWHHLLKTPSYLMFLWEIIKNGDQDKANRWDDQTFFYHYLNNLKVTKPLIYNCMVSMGFYLVENSILDIPENETRKYIDNWWNTSRSLGLEPSLNFNPIKMMESEHLIIHDVTKNSHRFNGDLLTTQVLKLGFHFLIEENSEKSTQYLIPTFYKSIAPIFRKAISLFLEDTLPQLQDDHGKARGLKYLSNIYYYDGFYDQAIKCNKKVLKYIKNPDELALLNYEIGSLSYKVGNTAEAIDYIQKGIELDLIKNGLLIKHCDDVRHLKGAIRYHYKMIKSCNDSDANSLYRCYQDYLNDLILLRNYNDLFGKTTLMTKLVLEKLQSLKVNKVSSRFKTIRYTDQSKLSDEVMSTDILDVILDRAYFHKEKCRPENSNDTILNVEGLFNNISKVHSKTYPLANNRISYYLTSLNHFDSILRSRHSLISRNFRHRHNLTSWKLVESRNLLSSSLFGTNLRSVFDILHLKSHKDLQLEIQDLIQWIKWRMNLHIVNSVRDLIVLSYKNSYFGCYADQIAIPIKLNEIEIIGFKEILPLLLRSISLNSKEKLKIIENFAYLSDSQINGLLKIFEKEQNNFRNLEENHLFALSYLEFENIYDWLNISTSVTIKAPPLA